MTITQESTPNTFDVASNLAPVDNSTELILNGRTIIHPSRLETANSLHGILMKMRSTIIITRGRLARANNKSPIILMRFYSYLLLTLLTCATMCVTTAHTTKYSSNVAKTKYGELRGIVVRSNPTVEAYLGVPYATPPVGSLR